MIAFKSTLSTRLYDRRDPNYRRSWAELKKAGITALRCGRHKGNSALFGKGCSHPQGHRGTCDFSVESQYERERARAS